MELKYNPDKNSYAIIQGILFFQDMESGYRYVMCSINIYEFMQMKKLHIYSN